MRKSFVFICLLVCWVFYGYGQSTSEEIQRLQKLVKENEERAIIAEARAKVAEEQSRRMRYLAIANELADRSNEIRDPELSGLLVLVAYNFNTQYGGYSFNSRIYNAMFNYLKKYEHLPQNLKGYLPTKNSTTFSSVLPNSSKRIVAEQNGDLRIVTENGATIRILSGHTEQVNQIAFSHSGLMATSGADSTIRVWNLSMINQRPIIIVENSVISDLTFSQDDSQLFYALTTSSGNPTIKMQPLDVKNIAAELCKVLKRNLTVEEWNVYVGSDLPYEQVCH